MIKDNFIIAIPSYKRAERLMKKIGPLNITSEDLMNQTFLFVREEETEEYLPVAEKFGCGLIPIVMMPEEGIPETRDRILEHCFDMGIKKLIMIDDDVNFAIHDLNKKKANYYTMDENMYADMIFELLNHTDEENALTGITARQFSNNRMNQVDTNGRIIQVSCMHIPTIEREGFHFTYGAPYCSDYFFVLSMLTQGFGNKILNTYTRDDNANEAGGCSVKRTADLQNKSAVALYKLFPEVVSLHQKSNGTWKEPRINPHIQWKKAFGLYVERKE